ncbi:hypothetical protein ACFL41_02455, partial [Gemmatimonadota bacterium]
AGFIYEINALSLLGKVDEIIALFEESKRLPVSVNYNPGLLLSSNAGPRLRGYGFSEESMTVLEMALDWYASQSGEENIDYRSRIASTLYFLERWQDARVIYTELHQETGEYLRYLGWIAAHLGENDEARFWGEQLAANTDTLTFNRYYSGRHQAMLAALLGDRERAVQLLRRSINEGSDHTPMLPRDIDFEGLWDYPPFQALFTYFP